MISIPIFQHLSLLLHWALEQITPNLACRLDCTATVQQVSSSGRSPVPSAASQSVHSYSPCHAHHKAAVSMHILPHAEPQHFIAGLYFTTVPTMTDHQLVKQHQNHRTSRLNIITCHTGCCCIQRPAHTLAWESLSCQLVALCQTHGLMCASLKPLRPFLRFVSACSPPPPPPPPSRPHSMHLRLSTMARRHSPVVGPSHPDATAHTCRQKCQKAKVWSC